MEVCVKADDCVHAPYSICVSGHCEHKDIWPIYDSELLGCFIMSLLSLLRAISGIGGVNIPISMTLFGFSTKEAIAICSWISLVGCVIRYILDLNERHPLKDATVIDYNIVILCMPMVLVGAFFGVLVNVVMPKIFLGVVLTYLAVSLFLKVYVQAKRIYDQEQRQNLGETTTI